uniref:SDR family NAD(P)-dependent oxidoreductase n=1 Tax=Sandarakinorhabdus sp. TaxID=1916663 RepID=UPI00286D7B30
MMRLHNRRYLVTGAARGIGLAIAQRLVAEGARVMLADVLPEGADRAAELGEAAAFVACDVTSRDQIEAAITATV